MSNKLCSWVPLCCASQSLRIQLMLSVYLVWYLERKENPSSVANPVSRVSYVLNGLRSAPGGWVWEEGMVGGLCTSNLPYFLHLSRTELIKLQFASGFFNFSPYYLTVKIYIFCFLSVHRRNNVFLLTNATNKVNIDPSQLQSFSINLYIQLSIVYNNK